MIHTTLDHLGTHYSSIEGLLGARIISRYSWQLIKDRIQGEHVLAFGLGDGYIAESLCSQARSVTILEGSSQLVKKFSCPDLCTIKHTLFEDFDPPHYYDSIVATHVLEHVKDPERFLRVAHSCLSTGGRAFFTVPNALSLHRRIGLQLGIIRRHDELGPSDLSVGHRRVYTPRSFAAELSRARFHILELRGYMIKLTPNRMMREWDDKLLDAVFETSGALPLEFCASLFAECTIKLGVGR